MAPSDLATFVATLNDRGNSGPTATALEDAAREVEAAALDAMLGRTGCDK